MPTEVVRNEERGRYEILVDGAVRGFSEYHEDGDRVVLPHTVVDPKWRGQGLASVLIRQALEDIMASGRAVVPQCWYVAGYIEHHPELQVPVAESPAGS